MEEVKRISRELKYKGNIVDMYEDTMAIPNGNIAHWDFIKHIGAAAVVPVMEDGKILMVRQYRNAVERRTLEVPAGALDYAKEPMIECAARELEEETGYRSENLEFLMNINTTVAFCNELIGIYVARDLVPSKQNLDEDEFVNVEAWEIDDLMELIYSGKMTDGKTAAALLAYKNKYCNN